MTNGIRTFHLSIEPKMSKIREMDFGSAGEDEFFEDLNSPTDNSEDSVEVKVSPISSRNKRKCTEPRKVPEKFTGPLKKRMCLKVQSEKLHSNELSAPPFRPWSPKPETKKDSVKIEDSEEPELAENVKIPQQTGFAVPHVIPVHPYAFPNPCEISTRMPSSYFRPPSPVNVNYHHQQNEPVALIKKCQKTDDDNVVVKKENNVNVNADVMLNVPCASSSKIDIPRVPVHPHASSMTPTETERLILSSNEAFPTLKRPSSANSKREQRNYKNMTRERRIEANARERTRVHTISAAFDTLRKAIPSYSHNQKLSKLSVLRIACSYIMTLSNIVNDDDPSKTAESVELITKTIQREGKLRKKKDDND